MMQPMLFHDTLSKCSPKSVFAVSGRLGMIAAKSVVLLFLSLQVSPGITATEPPSPNDPEDHGTAAAIGTSLVLSKRISVSEWETKPSGPWGRILGLPCSISIPTLDKAGDHADYCPDWGGRGGLTEILLRRWKTPVTLDGRVKAEIRHDGKVDTVVFNSATDHDDWLSLGKYLCRGTPDEFVRIIKQDKAMEMVTPVPGMRFDIYSDTDPRPMSDREKESFFPVGFAKVGNWNPSPQGSYRADAPSWVSVEQGAVATWNPALNEPGIYGVYVHKPNVEAGDTYEIFHQGKVDHVDLRDRTQSNFELGNPRLKQGWYKIGEFGFSATGGEGLRLMKTSSAVDTRADAVCFEKVDLEGTIVQRTVVLPIVADAKPSSSPREEAGVPFGKKVHDGKIAPGFSPEIPSEPSSKYGATVYARPLYLADKKIPRHWNPCINEAGDFEVFYYVYWPPNGNGEFTVHHQGKEDRVQVKKEQFKQGEFLSLGSFRFEGGTEDEYVEMTGLDRASEMLFERKLDGGRILRQVIVTVHPYFPELSYSDTKELPNAHDISVMVLDGVMSSVQGDRFSPEKAVTVEEFTAMLGKLVSADFPDAVKGIGYLPSYLSLSPSDPIKGYQAIALMEGALENSGRYGNVSNFGRVAMPEAEHDSPELGKIPPDCRPSVARMAALEIFPFTSENKALMERDVTRSDAASLLKNFREQGLRSGPPLDADWELTFHDEFKGNQIDWSKWWPRNMVRFKGYSAIWPENCEVKDGLLLLNNYLNNKIVPYSTGSLISGFGQIHGFFEARYSYPDRAYGSHSSFWVSCPGGDFNFNEGTYPNRISNNNYFMGKKPAPELHGGEPASANFNNFAVPANLARDMHTVSAFLDEKDLFYGLDGRITYEVKDYPKYYASSNSTTALPYSPIISSVVTYFDGPLDRDRIDGSRVKADWVRVFKSVPWQPELLDVTRWGGKFSGKAFLLTFNKPMNAATITAESVQLGTLDGKSITGCTIREITPCKYLVEVPVRLEAGTKYRVRLSPSIKDRRSLPLSGDREVVF